MTIKTYISGAILSCCFLTACDRDNQKLIYESETNSYVSFQTDKMNKELEKNENSLFIPVYRESNHGKATVNAELFFQKNPDGTEAPGREFISLDTNTIEFADGENTAGIKLNINLLQLDYLTKAKTRIELTESESSTLSTFGKSSLILSLSRKPTWTQMEGKGVYVSQFLGTEKEVVIQKAEEAPFYIIKDCYVANGDIRVDLDKNGNATIEQQKAFRHETYGIVYIAGTGELDSAENAIVMQLNFLVEQDGVWGILSGIAYEEKLILPAK